MIVVDAGVLANALGDDHTDGEAAREALRRQRSINAPGLIDVEILSVLRRRWLAGLISDNRFQRAVNDLATIPVVRHQMTELANRAFALRANVTPYDAMYVALAEGLGCTLLTGDRRLANAPGPQCRFEVLTT